MLVHHQLSCLLIHGAALKAGLYAEDSGEKGAASAAPGPDGGGGGCGSGRVSSHAAPEGSLELEHSIRSTGGSTAQLFSVALRDRQDLEAMEETLQHGVEELIENMRGEFDSAGCSAERSPVTATHILAALQGSSGAGVARAGTPIAAALTRAAAARSAPQSTSFLGSAPPVRVAGAAALARAAAVRVEAEAIERECDLLAQELSVCRDDVQTLREELREMQGASEDFHRSATMARFEEVHQAMERNAELEEILDQLTACTEAGFDVEHLAEDHPWADQTDALEPLAASARADHLPPRERHPRNCNKEPGCQSDPRGPQAAVVASMPGQAQTAATIERTRSAPHPRRGGHCAKAPCDGQVRRWHAPPASQWAKEREENSNTRADEEYGRGGGSACILASPESLAQLDVQLRASQSEFWGM